MHKKTCSIMGQQNISTAVLDLVEERLREEIVAAVRDGFTIFTTGMDTELDFLFTRLVAEQKTCHPHLFLEAVISHRNRLGAEDPPFRRCLAGCNGIYIHQEEYSRNCTVSRNRQVVGLSNRVIAVCGEEHPPFAIRYAHALKRDVRAVWI